MHSSNIPSKCCEKLEAKIERKMSVSRELTQTRLNKGKISLFIDKSLVKEQVFMRLM